MSFKGAFELAELDTFDHFMRKRPERDQDPRIVLVGVTESDVQYLKGWPVSDKKLTEILTKIKQQKPRVIGLDIVRDFPVMDGYDELTNFFRNTPNIIGIEGITKTNGRIAPPPVLAELDQVAIANLIYDSDTIIRRAYLVIQLGGESGKKDSLATALALKYLEPEEIIVTSVPNKKYTYQLGKSTFHLLKAYDGAYANKNIIGSQIIINYRGKPCNINHECKFPLISVKDLLENRFEADLLKDKIVIIGAFGNSLNDLHGTPYSNKTISSSTGIEIHAQITSQLLDAALEGNVLFQTWSQIGEWLWLFYWTIIGSIIGFCGAKKYLLILGIFPISLSLYGSTYFLFINNIWIPFSLPMFGFVGSAIATMIFILWQENKDYTKNLENKVRERTIALESTNIELANQNQALNQAKDIADAANRSKSQFLANMSHELRTPLNAILGFSQLMSRDELLTPTQNNYLNIINRSGEHLLSLINDVLDMSKIEAGRMTINLQSFNLYQTLETIEEMFTLRAQEKGLLLNFFCKQSVPKYIISDENKLRQILINLLGNALKFTNMGEVVLRVDAQVMDDENYALYFAVTDTGEGIESHEFSNVFRAFTQTETGKKSNQGTGLGLTISRKFVQMMGGDMHFSSVVNQGTTFNFDIQVGQAKIQDIKPIYPQKKVMSLVPDQRDYRILIVDDSWINRELLHTLLGSLGFRLRGVENGAEAIAVWQEWQPDLIWMDIRMPVMDGYEATKQIRHLEQQISSPECQRQPTVILALTASILEEDVIRVLECGCNDWLRKPFQEYELLEKMQRYLQLEYLYEDRKTQLSNLTAIAPQTKQIQLQHQLAYMPESWRQEFAHMALLGDDFRLLELIEKIPLTCPDLKTTLTTWVNEYQFERIDTFFRAPHIL
ncbi:MAG: CHASE2 domain-containing protein [Limnothrix sp. RL_2_0]|nr:CHASE2 domain-containing protein [Limnothrix sp. RL_2_0]